MNISGMIFLADPLCLLVPYRSLHNRECEMSLLGWLPSSIIPKMALSVCRLQTDVCLVGDFHFSQSVGHFHFSQSVGNFHFSQSVGQFHFSQSVGHFDFLSPEPGVPYVEAEQDQVTDADTNKGQQRKSTQ